MVENVAMRKESGNSVYTWICFVGKKKKEKKYICLRVRVGWADKIRKWDLFIYIYIMFWLNAGILLTAWLHFFMRMKMDCFLRVNQWTLFHGHSFFCWLCFLPRSLEHPRFSPPTLGAATQLNFLSEEQAWTSLPGCLHMLFWYFSGIFPLIFLLQHAHFCAAHPSGVLCLLCFTYKSHVTNLCQFSLPQPSLDLLSLLGACHFSQRFRTVFSPLFLFFFLL